MLINVFNEINLNVCNCSITSQYGTVKGLAVVHIIMVNIVLFLNQVCARQRLVFIWFLEIVFVRKVSMLVCVCVCVSAPKTINYIHVILHLYNQLNKFVAFRNIMKLSMHGCGLCNEACLDRNRSNKAMLAP